MQTDLPSSAPALGSLADTATGRELDALVAEHIFGWTDIINTPGRGWRGFVPKEQWDSAYCGRSPWFVSIEEYSTDHNAAALVLVRAWKIGARVTLIPSESACLVRWMLTSMPEVMHGTWGKTMPEAICRAALKAMERQQVNKNAVPQHEAAQEPQPAVYWCRCVHDCATRMTLAERDHHEAARHPGVKPRKDLDDTPPELRRASHA